MTINWAVLTDYIGVGFGYSTHQKRLSEALLRNGVKFDSSAGIAVHLTTPEAYKPVEGAYNILYTMYECQTLPKSWIAPLEKADLIVVPCKQNKYLFEKYTDKPIEICLEGVDVDSYSYIDRVFPEGKAPFIYLWCGATNPRKGTDYMILAWEELNKYWWKKDNRQREKMLLVMKTTQQGDSECPVEIVIHDARGRREIKEKKITMPAERIRTVGGNCVIDTRRLPILPGGTYHADYPYPFPQSMQEIYHQAHAFIFPTRGEGFGLTLAEAMATGLPVAYTPWSGVMDYMDDTLGYPLKFGFRPVKTMGKNFQTGEWYVSHESTAAAPDVDSIVRRMIQIRADYETALQKGKKAARFIRENFTWDISARRMIEIIEKYTKERIAA